MLGWLSRRAFSPAWFISARGLPHASQSCCSPSRRPQGASRPAADKLYNARTILGDYCTEGDDLWARFLGSKDGTPWMFPPFSSESRGQAGYLLLQLQMGVQLSLPHSRPMPSIGARCHELKINDSNLTWRIVYRTDPDAILILEVFKKKTGKTPQKVLEICRWRLQHYADVQ